MIIGVDLGNYYTKNSEGIKFESRISRDHYILSGCATKVKYKDVLYLIEAGTFNININKVFNQDTLVSLATIIGMSSDDYNIDLGVGIPINYYKSYKDVLLNMIKDEKEFVLEINGGEKRFIINKCFVIPEAVGVYYSLSKDIINDIGNREILIIDIGGKTTDMCVIDNNVTIKKPSTQPIGFLNLYNDMANLINSKYPDLCVATEDMRYILDNGLTSSGDSIDISFVYYLFDKLVDTIMNYIKLQYQDYKRKVVMLCGGGYILEDKFRKYIPNILINDDIFANAKGFKKYVAGIGNRYA